MINELRAKDYCCDDISLIENYQRAIDDKDNIWVIHHRKETDEGLSKNELRNRREYFSRPANELIFLTKSEHSVMHSKGKKLSEETKEKIRLSVMGNKNLLGHKVSEEQKQKQREKMLGRVSWNKGISWSEDTKRKNAEAHLGKIHSEESKTKISEGNKGLRYWNNGVKNVRARECPEGFVSGRLCRSK